MTDIRTSLESAKKSIEEALAALPKVTPNSPVPLAYSALTDRALYNSAPAAPPKLTPFNLNPWHSTKITRLTDPSTYPRSCSTPSSSHVRAFSCDNAFYYIRTVDGGYLVYRTLDNSFVCNALFTFEPTFSHARPGILIGISGGGSVIREYNILNGAWTSLLDLKTLPGWPTGEAYAGTLTSGGNTPDTERIAVLYGGTSQDLHTRCLVFNRAAPEVRSIVPAGDVSTIPTFHGMGLDQSGEYLTLFPRGSSIGYTKKIGSTLPFTAIAPYGHGHAAFGWGRYANQSGDGQTPYDAAQWKVRKLNNVASYRNLISPTLTPQLVFGADHPSWHNDHPDFDVPFITGFYRHSSSVQPICPPRAWDTEILAIHPLTGQVWRLGPHFSDTARPQGGIYWATPRVQVSPNGLVALAASNWGRTLGPDNSDFELNGSRVDVFRYDLVPA
jgi:hypothetical protein